MKTANPESPAIRKWMADKIKALRTSQKLKQEYVASKIGMKSNAYAKAEFATVELSALRLKRLCALYNLTMDQFMEDCPYFTSL